MAHSLIMCHDKGAKKSKQQRAADERERERDFDFNEMSRNTTGRQTPNKLSHLPARKTHIDKCSENDKTENYKSAYSHQLTRDSLRDKKEAGDREGGAGRGGVNGI